MYRTRKQSSTTYPIMILMVDENDHQTAMTGQTVTVTLSKNGGAFGAAAGAVAEVGNGFYSLAGNADDRDTLGSLVILATASGCDVARLEYEVVPYDVFEAVAAQNAGDGPHAVTINVKAGGVNVQGASVSMSNGTTVFARTTDASGNAAFSLTTATWTSAIAKAGYDYTPATHAVSANATLNLTITATAITPAADPSQTTGYLTTRDGGGTAQASVILYFSLVDPGTSDGHSYPQENFSATSNGSGLLEVTLLRSASYKAKRGLSGAWVSFTTGSSATFQLPEVLGQVGS